MDGRCGSLHFVTLRALHTAAANGSLPFRRSAVETVGVRPLKDRKTQEVGRLLCRLLQSPSHRRAVRNEARPPILWSYRKRVEFCSVQKPHTLGPQASVVLHCDTICSTLSKNLVEQVAVAPFRRLTSAFSLADSFKPCRCHVQYHMKSISLGITWLSPNARGCSFLEFCVAAWREEILREAITS